VLLSVKSVILQHNLFNHVETQPIQL